MYLCFHPQGTNAYSSQNNTHLHIINGVTGSKILFKSFVKGKEFKNPFSKM